MQAQTNQLEGKINTQMTIVCSFEYHASLISEKKSLTFSPPPPPAQLLLLLFFFLSFLTYVTVHIFDRICGNHN